MSSDDEGHENLMVQALPVNLEGISKSNFDLSAAPTSAEDYLKKVVWEARQCADVVTVELNENQIRKQGPVVKKKQKMRAPSGFYPSLEVQREFLVQFSQLREKIERCKSMQSVPHSPFALPDEDDQEDWCKLCFGNNFQRNLLMKNGSSNISEIPKLVEGKQPLLSILLNISPVLLENLIEWHANWLEVAGFSELQGCWLFSLLACLEKPLTPEMCSTLRHVLQLCAVIRASLESADHPHLIHLNMLITIIAKYFNQDDLADP